MQTTPIITLKNVSKCFASEVKPALANIHCEIYKGKMTGVVGPDGAGKTTLIRLFIGLLEVTKGEIAVSGLNPVQYQAQIHDMTGYMPQKFGLYEDLSVIENLNLYANLRDINNNVRQLKFEQLLTFTDLKSFTHRLAGKLSGGMKQKLGLACALIGEPKILLLDEPSIGVDPISRLELWRMVKALQAKGMSVVWSTSYLDEAELCDDVLLLNEGQLIYSGPPKELLKKVESRTWHITGIDSKVKRHFLMNLLQQSEVMDGVIQGRNIRVVLREKTGQPELTQGHWVAVKPCFEDAFINELGGGPKGISQLASMIKVKPETEKPVICAENLVKKFGDFTAVKNSSFKIYRGEIFGLLGPNGAGKTTTFKMMCGLLQPTKGKAIVAGLDLRTATSKARSKIGYMAQKFSLYGNLNIKQNLSFFSKIYGLSGKKQRQQIELMIDLFDFKNHLHMSANALPLGFKQRLALACSVMHEPDILFLDEPTSGVDPVTRREFWMHINAMIEKGVTIMVTTHFMDEAEYCDRIGLIYRGVNIAIDTPDALKKKVKTNDKDDPSLEQAFIRLIQSYDNKEIESVS